METDGSWAVHLVILWKIWDSRNAKVFRSRNHSTNDMFSNVISDLDLWTNWCRDPVLKEHIGLWRDFLSSHGTQTHKSDKNYTRALALDINNLIIDRCDHHKGCKHEQCIVDWHLDRHIHACGSYQEADDLQCRLGKLKQGFRCTSLELWSLWHIWASI
jgi:hypothetical protein